MSALFWFPKKSQSFYLMRWLFFLGFYGAICGVLLIAGILYYFAQQVPDYRQLADYQPQLITKVYDRHGELLAEYAKQRRLYVPIDEIPESVKLAYLAAEDWSFYQHGGYDLRGIFRAAMINIFTNRKQGASTITQQVAKTFLLTRERTYTRKIKELILSHRIERAFSKDHILELYLNRIYLGNGTYGVAAAALGYFGKDLADLDDGERALLAGLPKAPSRYNPFINPQEARWRRDVILGRMYREGLITREQRDEEIARDFELNRRRSVTGKVAPHFSEHVRKFLSKTYGFDVLYKGGLNVYTTLDREMQLFAEQAVYKGLRAYDRRHGFRGPIGRMGVLYNWQIRIGDMAKQWRDQAEFGQVAVVLAVDDEADVVHIGLEGGTEGIIPLSRLTWARDYLDVDTRGPRIRRPSDVLDVQDLILVKALSDVPDRKKNEALTHTNGRSYYSLEQIPAVQGSLVALDPTTGAVRAMVGGLGDGRGFNRAVQARRQVGSSIKPFVYALALESGYTPASIILDAPIVMRSDEAAWKPQNYTEKVYGPSTLRLGLEKSRNLMTIRLARALGIRPIIRYADKFGLTMDASHGLSAALGSSVHSLMDMTSAYSVFANKGQQTPPYFIDSIQDASGRFIFTHHTACHTCDGPVTETRYLPPQTIEENNVDVIPDTVAYQMTYLLQGIVENGTAARARAVGKTVGAKTGTTNDAMDAWFMGISPNLAIGSWVGFDNPRTLGRRETGSRAAAPIWVDFAKNALAQEGNLHFSVPEGIQFVRIDRETGGLPTASTQKRLLEAFVAGTGPVQQGSQSSYQVIPATDIQFQGIY